MRFTRAAAAIPPPPSHPRPPLSHSGDTPRDMQLDFVLTRASKPPAFIELRHLKTKVVSPEVFHAPGRPLSDHYALMATWRCKPA